MRNATTTSPHLNSATATALLALASFSHTLRSQTATSPGDQAPTVTPEYDLMQVAPVHERLKQAAILNIAFEYELASIERSEPRDTFLLATQQSLNRTPGQMARNVTHTPATDYVAWKIADVYLKSSGQISPQALFIYTGRLWSDLSISNPADSKPSALGSAASAAATTLASEQLAKGLQHIRGPELLKTTGAAAIIAAAATAVSNGIEQHTLANWQALQQAIKKAESSREVNYRVLEHIKTTQPQLYDSIVYAISNMPDLEGVKKSNKIFIPKRELVDDLSSGVTNLAEGLISKAVRLGKQNSDSAKAEKAQVDAAIKGDLDKLEKQATQLQAAADKIEQANQAESRALEKLFNELKKAGLAPKTLAEIPSELSSSHTSQDIEQTREAKRAALREFNAVGHELGNIVSRLNPKAGASIQILTNAYSTAAIAISGGMKTLKLSDCLSFTSLAISLIDILLSDGKDPTLEYLERIDGKLNQVFDGVVSIQKHLYNLEELVREQFRVTQAGINALAFDQQREFEATQKMLRDMYKDLKDGQIAILDTTRRIEQICRVSLHINNLTLEAVENIMKRFEAHAQNSVSPDFRKNVEKLYQALNNPTSSNLNPHEKATLQETVARDLMAIAALRSEDAWVLYTGDSRFSESSYRAVNYLDLPRHGRAVATWLSLDNEKNEPFYRGLIDTTYFAEIVQLLSDSSGKQGFPVLKQETVDLLWANTRHAYKSTSELGQVLLTHSAREIAEKILRLRTHITTEANHSVPIQVAGTNYTFNYQVSTGPASLQGAIDKSPTASIPTEIQTGARTFYISSNEQLAYSCQVENSHWYQEGQIKIHKNVIVKRGSSRGGKADWQEPDVYETKLVEEWASGSCGGPGKVEWTEKLPKTILLEDRQTREIGIGQLLFAPAFAKCQVLSSHNGGTILKHTADQPQLETVARKFSSAKYLGNTHNKPENPFKEGDRVVFTFEAGEMLVVKPSFSGSIGTPGSSLATYQVSFDGTNDSLPTAVEIKSIQHVIFILGKYIKYLSIENFPGADGLKPAASTFEVGSHKAASYHTPKPSDKLDTTAYLETTNAFITKVAPLIYNFLNTRFGTSWLDGLSSLEIASASTAEDSKIGVCERQGSKLLRFTVKHYNGTSQNFEVALPTDFTNYSLAPRILVNFPHDLSKTRLCPENTSSLPTAIQTLVDAERQFHSRQVVNLVERQLGKLKLLGSELQQSHISFAASMLLMRLTLNEFGRDILNKDREIAAQEGTPFECTIQGLLSERPSSALNFSLRLDALEADLANNKPINQDALLVLCNGMQQALRTLEDRISRTIKAGARFTSPDLERAANILHQHIEIHGK